MKVAIELVFDEETAQWCAGMVSPPWVSSCGRTPREARRRFLEAFRAFFEAAKTSKRGTPKRRVR